MAKDNCGCISLLKELKSVISNEKAQKDLRDSKEKSKKKENVFNSNTIIKQGLISKIEDVFYLKVCKDNCNHYSILQQINRITDNYEKAMKTLRNEKYNSYKNKVYFRRRLIQSTFSKLEMWLTF